DFNHLFSITLSMWTWFSNHLWLMLSKNPVMSASSTHWAEAFWDKVTNNWDRASCVDRPFRNPYEFGSDAHSTAGSSASRCSACIALSFMVGTVNVNCTVAQR